MDEAVMAVSGQCNITSGRLTLEKFGQAIR
jgi:hypothetical protein